MILPVRAAGLDPLPRPLVAGHRGASGYLPEHTLGAYREAIRHGVDAIEIDLVVTADGVLVARHDRELSHATDVADRTEFADRRRHCAIIDGEGWFAEDLTLAELKTLAATERMPHLRPDNLGRAGEVVVATLAEILDLLEEEAARAGRRTGLLVEIKDVDHLRSLGLDPAGPLLAELDRRDLLDAGSGVALMSFEEPVLHDLRAACSLPIVQLLERHYPHDPARLSEIAAYADAIGPHKTMILSRDEDDRLAGPTSLVADAAAEGLAVWVWTLRAENVFLPADLRIGANPEGHGDLAREARELTAAGVRGLITDQPDLVMAAVDGGAADGS